MSSSAAPFRVRAGHFLVNLVLGGLMALLLALPYGMRVNLTGWLFAHVVGPLAGWRKRIRENLSLIWPDLPEDRLRALERGVADNSGRSLIEIYSSRELRNRLAGQQFVGPGVPAFDAARAAGRPIVFASAHFGNYEAGRAGLANIGCSVAALYRPLNNPYFNRHYEAAMSVSGALFPRGRRGLAEMVRHLKQGGNLAILLDQHMGSGAELTFMGHRAYTSTTLLEIARRQNALVLPCFAVRQPDGLSFELRLEAPIPDMEPEAMAQAYNDALEVKVKAHPEQWLWVHRRWKDAG
ncbi:lysophospholipid acyltransferase family protein [Pseudooceanicola algae]|uniref:Lipid A biosynthesis lauroyltransferase n=1 Tax=Pseudooceanicola algae TaxID=1537215 RepID=A0A418SC45_9RHOB|nr:lysophospholipid acyltransferase family protein [Pseudooceanicola algae]QPM89961.1 Lipid A biosynthesis lauroyltransferase [Pseudooceanicola algae]